ncbi:MAG: hypothetical protein P8J48_02870 [SAR86 cluster bacterium]|nr:hypothetical protein [SAR86 cluster bacterium]
MNKRFKECLLDVYHAEQTGEVIFESMLRYAQNKEERFILGSMLQLETEAKAIMRPSLVQLELPIEEEKLSREQGIIIGESFKEIPFAELMQNIEQSVRNIYLPQYEELETLITEEDSDYFKLAKFMGDHERALLLSAENINSNFEDPMKPVTEMLRFPIFYNKEK